MKAATGGISNALLTLSLSLSIPTLPIQIPRHAHSGRAEMGLRTVWEERIAKPTVPCDRGRNR